MSNLESCNTIADEFRRTHYSSHFLVSETHIYCQEEREQEMALYGSFL